MERRETREVFPRLLSRIVVFLLLLLSAPAAASDAASGAAIPRIATPRLVVGGDHSYPLYAFLDGEEPTGFNILKATGEYKGIYDRWFGLYEQRARWETLKYLAWALGMIAVLLVVSLLWSWTLRKRVAQRTEELKREVAEHVRTEAVRRQAEAVLQESEERLELALEGSKDGLWDWNIVTGAAYYSARWQTMLGFEPGEVEPHIRSWEGLVHPDDVDGLTRILREHLEGRTSHFEAEHRIKTKSEDWMWVLCRGKVVERDQNGEPLRAVGTQIDITRRKQMEEALRESEERYRLLAQNATDMISRHTQEGTYIYASPTCRSLVGYEPEELIGHAFYDFIHPGDVGRIREAFATVLAQSTIHTSTYRLRRKGGRYAWVETASRAVKDPDTGDVEQVVAITRDVTERQQAQEEIKRLARFPEENPNPVMRIDADSTLLYANRASRPLLRVWDCQVGQPLPEAWHILAREVVSSRSRRDTEVRCGKRIFSLTLAPAGDTAYINIYGLDVTERKQAQERIQRLLDQQITINRLALAVGETRDLGTIYGTIYEHVRSLVEAWGFIVSSYDEESRLIRAEYAVYKDVPIDVTEFPPIPLAESGGGAQSRVILSGEPFYAPDHRASVETGETEYTVSENGTITEGPPPDEADEDFTKSSLYVPMKVGGKVLGVMQLQSPQLDAYSQEDIDLLSGVANMAAVAVQNARLFETLQRSNEELARHRQHLEDLIAERTAELDRRMVDVEQLNRALSNLLEDQQATNRTLEATTAQLAEVNQELENFAYVVSHDLKAPLRAITQLADWISTDYAHVLDEGGQEYLHLLIGRTRRMHNLIEGILQYSRVGRVRERERDVDLNRLVRDVTETLAPPEHIQVTVPNQLPTVVGEPTRLGQLFQNLLDNAIKYMDKPEGRISVDSSDNDSHWLFSVADNGPGIEEKYYDKVFQMFQTLAPRDEVESTGVGLALAKKIVETNGGKIWVESVVSQGSTFRFTLPKKGETDDEDIQAHPAR